MKIIVTGGSGFLGTHMIRALVKEGHQVLNIDLRLPRKTDEMSKYGFTTIQVDIRDTDKMKEIIKDADVVFHFAGLIEAGESVKQPAKFIDYNINGTLSVLEAMRVNNIKTIIFSSSAAIYGEPLSIPIKEDDRSIPINPYGMNKLAMEGLISSYVKAHNFNGVALRYFNLYGPEEHHVPETHAMPRFIKQIYEDKEVTVYGSGEHLRDYIYITDIVEAHLKALEFVLKYKNKYHYFNLSTQKPSSTLDIANLVATAMNKEAKIVHLPERLGDPLVLYADATKAKDQLNWQVKVSITEGITETVKYFINEWRKK